MTPLERYAKAIKEGELTEDEEQLQVVNRLESIFQQLVAPAAATPQTGLFSRWFKSRKSISTPTVSGLYLWGGVGRGKTLLTDMFYETVPDSFKSRLHFHRFMKMIHDELGELKRVENPLQIVAENWVEKSRLLVLDEMHVFDITDAMLLGGLLTELFKRGVTLVTTSNVKPDDLYRDGLQRDRFVPAIELIKLHTLVYEMMGDTDYRLRALESADTYLLLDHPNVSAALESHFDRLVPREMIREVIDSATPLSINGREIKVVRCAEGIAWFTFGELCNTPRSTHDYIEIASVFHSLIVSGVPVLDDTRNDAARRLVNLIDELYDRGVNLIVSAEAKPENLYAGTRLEFEFVRAASRLREMQTVEYLGGRHLPD